MEEISIKIDKLLVEKRIKKQDFLKDIGVSTSGYYDMIKKNTMSIQTLEKICKVLDKPLSYFLFNSDHKDIVPVVNPDEASIKEGYIKSLTRQNEEMSRQITDLIKMQLINAETIKNLTSK